MSQQDTKTSSIFLQKNHSEELIIGDKNVGVETKRNILTIHTEKVHLSLLSQIELNSLNEEIKEFIITRK